MKSWIKHQKQNFAAFEELIEERGLVQYQPHSLIEKLSVFIMETIQHRELRPKVCICPALAKARMMRRKEEEVFVGTKRHGRTASAMNISLGKGLRVLGEAVAMSYTT